MNENSAKESKFAGILTAKRGKEEPKPITSSQVPTQSTAERGIPGALIKGRGRPRGKRSDPGFEQVTAYIGRATHRDVKIALLTEGEGREFSELVEDLLSNWLSLRI